MIRAIKNNYLHFVILLCTNPIHRSQRDVSNMELISQVSEEKSLNRFKIRMQEFPCSFNLGCVDVSDVAEAGKTWETDTPIIRSNTFAYLNTDLENEIDDEEFESEVWKKNLQTRILFEVNKVDEAHVQNKKILEKFPDNLTALANSAFLYFHMEEVDESCRVSDKLKECKNSPGYKHMKFDTLIEQAYAYRKFGGVKNLLSCIKLLTFVSSEISIDEKIQFQLALVYRRICMTRVSWQYDEYPQAKHFAAEAATRLHYLGTSATDPTIRAAAIAELAYLRCADRFKGTHLVSTEIWRDLLGDMAWKELCFMALKITSSNERVLKMVGTILKSDPKTLDKANDCLKRAIEIRPSSRAYHHLGLTYVQKAIRYEFINHKEQIIPLQKVQTDSLNPAEQRLQRLLKVAKEKYLPLSADNEFAKLAEDNLCKAVQVSHKLNIKAHYDLVLLIARRQNYSKAKQTCKELIKFFQNTDLEMVQQFSLVSVYDLYGTICAVAAEKAATEEGKKIQMEECEEYLMEAVRMATHLAVTVPEFKNCATSLWNSFSRLRTRYDFEASHESQKKLFQLCDLVKDYRNLPQLGEMISFLEMENCNKECIEIYVKNMLSNYKYVEAAHFLDMVKIRFGEKSELSWRASDVIKDVMLHQARRSLKIPHDGIDPIWLNIMKEEYADQVLEERNESPASLQSNVNTCLKPKDSNPWRVVIVEDIFDDYIPIPGSWSDKVSRVLKEIMELNFGLAVDRCHEIGRPGEQVMSTLQKAIVSSTVTIFVIDNELNSTTTGVDSERKSQPEVPNVYPSCDAQTDESCSAQFNYLVEAALASKLKDNGPVHILSVMKNSKEQLPSPLLLTPTLVLSREDVDSFSQASNIKLDDEIEIVMKIFCTIVRAKYVSPKVPELHQIMKAEHELTPEA